LSDLLGNTGDQTLAVPPTLSSMCCGVRGAGHIAGAMVQTYMLERPRVTAQVATVYAARNIVYRLYGEP
jgi:hypothetical protein